MKTMDILLAMQTENREQHAELVKKVDGGFTDMRDAFASHAREDDKRFAEVELKLQPLVELQHGVRWARRSFYGASFVALVTEAFHIMFKHVK